MLVQIYKDYSFYYVYNLYLNKMNRLTDIYLGNTHSQIVYDPLGRMASKQADGQTVFANASFAAAAGQPARPHAMKSAETAEGVFPSESQTITYTGFDKVKTIAEGGNTLVYTYGYDQQRIRMVENVGDMTRTKDYVGVCEYIAENDGNNTTTKTLTYLVGPYGVFAVVEKQGNEESVHYILKDHLGSWTTISDAEGNVEQELSFDAWGSLRNPTTWSGSFSGTPMFDRGFTGHEHISAFGLINMNGRCYDPLTSSFLSVDAYVQDPTSAQAFNRYAYCGYNPLRYTDPTGWSQRPRDGNVNPNLNTGGHTTYYSDDPNDMLLGRSVHPCNNGSSGYVNGTAVTSMGYTQGNNSTNENNTGGGSPIIDPSEMTKSQQEAFNDAMRYASENSSLFKTLYEILANFLVIYKIRIGETLDNCPGQFNPNDKSITFRDDNCLTEFLTYSEELFHALQDENRSLYNSNEFNYEYEAKVAKFYMYAQTVSVNNVVANDSFNYTLNYFSPNGIDIYMPTAQTITSYFFLRGYNEGARQYAEWNRLYNPKNTNYSKSTLQRPVSLIRLFQ